MGSGASHETQTSKHSMQTICNNKIAENKMIEISNDSNSVKHSCLKM